jgi:hypothetical protein
MRIPLTAGAAVLFLALGGCVQFAPPATTVPAATLPPPPSATIIVTPPGGVDSQTLDPLDVPPGTGTGTPPNGQAGAPTNGGSTNEPTVVAGGSLTVPQLLGVWNIASGGESCQLTISQTEWLGGYRATTINCLSTELRSIRAWSLAGSEVEIKDATPAVILRLRIAGANRFTGTLAGSGRIVTVFR